MRKNGTIVMKKLNTNTIQIKNLCFSYATGNLGRERHCSDHAALSNINLSIGEGEYIALLGANGSGKSSLLRLLAGLLEPSKGEILYTGESDIKALGKGELAALAALVFQNPDDQIVASTVEEDCLFGPLHQGLALKEAKKRANYWLDFCGLTALASRSVAKLSGGERQRLAIAGALALDRPFLLLDEPLSMLNPATRSLMLELFDRLHCEEKKTLIHVSHSLDEALRAQRIVYLEEGRIVFDGSRANFLQALRSGRFGPVYSEALQVEQALQAYFPGLCFSSLDPLGFARELSLLLSAYVPAPPQGALEADGKGAGKAGLQASGEGAGKAGSDRDAFRAINLSHEYGQKTAEAFLALDKVNLSVPAGSALAVVGPSGSGKSTLLYHANAILLASGGCAQIWGKNPRDRRVDTNALRRRCNLAIQDAETALYERFVADDVAAGLMRAGKKSALTAEELSSRVAKSLSAVGLGPAAFWNRAIVSLSGGEKRKVALASVLVLEGDFLILDEPSAALDGESIQKIRSLIRAQMQAGKTLMLCTHSMEEAALCQNMAVFKEGKLVASGSTRELFGAGWQASWELERPWATACMAALKKLLPAASSLPWPLNAQELAEIIQMAIEPSGQSAPSSTKAPVFPAVPTPQKEDCQPLPKRHRRRGSGELTAFFTNSYGSYLARPSILQKMSVFPRSLIFMSLILCLLLSFKLTASLAVLAGVLLLSWPLARIRPIELLRNIGPALPLIGILVLFQLLWPRSVNAQESLYRLGPLIITLARLLNIALLVSRLVAFMAIFSLAIAVTSEREFNHLLKIIIRPLRHWKGLGLSLELGLAITLRFIPLLMEESRKIFIAQYSRGLGYKGQEGPIRRIRSALSLVLPLLIRCMERAERMAIAMEQRMAQIKN